MMQVNVVRNPPRYANWTCTWAMEFSINVFTLNCWGIPVISKNRKERLEALVTYLNESSHDFICLQEIWSETDYFYLKEKLEKVFPYAHYFYSGVLGSGLCVFSRWLIQDVFFHQWTLNGYIHKIHHGDWFGGKGLGLCRIKYEDKLINVYCTHLHAEYHEDDIYLAHRVLQALAAGEFVKLTSGQADVSVLAGDLNTAPGDLAFRLIKQLPCLQDPFDLPCDHLDPQIRRSAGTSDNVNNSYSDPMQTQKAPEGKRIDHIMFRVNDAWQARVIDYGNPLEDRVPGQPFSYSDHNAVSLKLQLKPTKPAPTKRTSVQNDISTQDITAEAITVCQEARNQINRTTKLYLTLGGVSFMFLLGTVGFWPSNVLFDIIKLISTGFCFYFLVMGTLWNMIELNSLKAGLSALDIAKSQMCSNR